MQKNDLIAGILIFFGWAVIGAQTDQATQLKNFETKLEESYGTEKIDTLVNIAKILRPTDPSKAMSYCHRANDLAYVYRYKKGKAEASYLLGDILANLERDKSALRYFKKASLNYSAVKDKGGNAKSLLGIAKIYTRQNQNEEADRFFKQALSQSIEANLITLKEKVCFNMAEFYFSTDRYEESLKYHKQYVGIKEKIFNLENKHKISEMQSKYNTLKQKKLNDSLRRNNELLRKNYKIQNLSISKAKITKNAFVIGFILVLVIAFLIFYRFKRIQEAESKIFSQKNELENAFKQLEDVHNQLSNTNDKLEVANQELSRLATVDGLTGLYNHRYYVDFLKREWKRSIRKQTEMAVIFIDVDFFKDFNDTYGHQKGDDCLVKISHVLTGSAKRHGDLIARYGGEEFIMILNNIEPAEMEAFVKQINEDIEALKIKHNKSTVSRYVTVSVGCASMTPQKEEKSSILIKAADEALYQSKDDGRNRYTIRAI